MAWVLQSARTMARWPAFRHTQRMLKLHFAGYQPARSVHTRGLHALCESVARRSDGALGIRVTDSIVAQGRKAADLLTMVESGEIDGCYFASSYLAARVPALGVFDEPFQAGARDVVFSRLDGNQGRALAEEVAAATGYRALGWWDNGIRHISNGVRPIRTPADCVGLRLRTVGQCASPGCVPAARLPAHVRRRGGPGAGGGGPDGGRPGKSPDQHD